MPLFLYLIYIYYIYVGNVHGKNLINIDLKNSNQVITLLLYTFGHLFP